MTEKHPGFDAGGCRCHQKVFCPDLEFSHYEEDQPIFKRKTEPNPAILPSDETRPAIQAARDMLAAGINIQATGEATNAVVTGMLTALFAHIDELEADLNCAIAVGRLAASVTTQGQRHD